MSISSVSDIMEILVWHEVTDKVQIYTAANYRDSEKLFHDAKLEFGRNVKINYVWAPRDIDIDHWDVSLLKRDLLQSFEISAVNPSRKFR